jgi:hypothetical protein
MDPVTTAIIASIAAGAGAGAKDVLRCCPCLKWVPGPDRTLGLVIGHTPILPI